MFLFLRNHGLDARQVAAREAQLERRIELAERLLNAHPEQLILELLRARLQVVHRQIAQFRHVHHDAFSSANRVANFVWMGSFDAASRSASRASVWVTPSISNRIRPGLTTHTHSSGAPLPLPMRVSCGFLVIGLSGNTRTQILPPRLMNRVIATRAASICRDVSQHGSSARSPKFPNDTSEPRHALPRMRPRCCFRYLTFFGINIFLVPRGGPTPARLPSLTLRILIRSIRCLVCGSVQSLSSNPARLPSLTLRILIR